MYQLSCTCVITLGYQVPKRVCSRCPFLWFVLDPHFVSPVVWNGLLFMGIFACPTPGYAVVVDFVGSMKYFRRLFLGEVFKLNEYIRLIICLSYYVFLYNGHKKQRYETKMVQQLNSKFCFIHISPLQWKNTLYEHHTTKQQQNQSFNLNRMESAT